MRFNGFLAAILMSLAIMASKADAATISGAFDFSAVNFGPGAPVDPVTGSFHYEFDPAQAYFNDTNVITNFTSNINFSGPIYFTIVPGTGFISFSGDGSGPVIPGTNNFYLLTLTDLSPLAFGYSQVGASQIFNSTNLTLTPSTVPIPGAVLMLVTALGGLGGFGFLRRRSLASSTAAGAA